MNVREVCEGGMMYEIRFKDGSEKEIETLSGADLTGADLTNANLTNANLRHAHLTGADLTGATLRYANLRYADLTGATLRYANLTGADLTGADIRYADLTSANLRYADLAGADLTGANIDYSVWPLWCGSLGVKVDVKIARQLVYHALMVDCDDPEFLAVKAIAKDFANKFHRVENKECKKVE